MGYIKVVLFKTPGAFDDPLTYALPEEMEKEVRIGTLVHIPLRQKKALGMVVAFEGGEGIDISKIKQVSSVVLGPGLLEKQVELAKVLSVYYRVSLLRMIRLLLPTEIWKKGILKKGTEDLYKKPAYDLFPLADFEHRLTSDQQAATEKILASKIPILLHGVTGSGKTEVYLRVILETVKKGRQALLLLPEIALTPQMIVYFKRYFGDHIALFHSRLSDRERAVEWFKAKSGFAPLVIGSRSAIFAPHAGESDFGVIIMDEEHEWTYKQESSPYYETHRVAEERFLKTKGCHLVFGSATPRMETLHKTQLGQYERVLLPQRVEGGPMPAIEVVDLREEFKQRHFSIFSRSLIRKMTETLAQNHQIILFVNQRGVARAVTCRDCGHTERCPNCEVSLTFHRSYGNKKGERLVCHYCHYDKSPPLVCPECQSPHIKHMGVGTQRVEEELGKLFPKARVLRADKDTTGLKEGFDPIYQAFKKGEADILVGTQMIAKGLDFKRVSLIGVVLADIGLHIPDFRGHERLFQLITQVAGRCGRNEDQGQVVLQTYQPDHFAIQKAAAYAYDDFMEREISFRKQLFYPPFSRLIKFTVVGDDAEKLRLRVEKEQGILEEKLKEHHLEAKILSAPAVIARMANQYYHHLFIRAENPHLIFEFWSPPADFRVDVDPVHTA